jgi:lysophospholipase L1-like esterase
VNAQVRTPTHVACVGDSITAGYMASSANASYPSDLQRLFGNGVQVKNFGHSGATLLSSGDTPYVQQSEYTAATTFVSGAGATAVVDVALMLGTNDSKSQNWMMGSGTRAQQFVADLGSLVDHFTGLASHPVVFLMLPPRSFANSYGISGTIIHDQILPLIRQVAASKSAPIIDLDALTASRSDLFPDGVHPNDTGYQLVAQTVHDGLLLPLSGGGQGGQSGQGGRPAAGGQAGHAASGGASGGGSGVGGHSGSGGAGSGGTVSGSGGIAGSGGISGSGGTGSGGTASGGAGSGGNPAPGSGGGPIAPGTGGGSGGMPASGGSADASTTGTGGGSGGAGTGGAPSMGQPANAGGGCSCALSRERDRSLIPAAGFSLLIAVGVRLRRRRSPRD